ncbi:MAG: ferrous iron transport protein A [Eubacteriales bacterium]
MNLCQVSAGEICRVRAVTGGEPLIGRMAALGICRGSIIRLVSVGPGGVRIVRVRGMRLALGRQTAAGISVVRLAKTADGGVMT